MSTLAEIEAAAGALPPEQQKALFHFLALRLRLSDTPCSTGHVARQEDDVLLQAPPAAPTLTPEHVQRILENWPSVG